MSGGKKLWQAIGKHWQACGKLWASRWQAGPFSWQAMFLHIAKTLRLLHFGPTEVPPKYPYYNIKRDECI